MGVGPEITGIFPARIPFRFDRIGVVRFRQLRHRENDAGMGVDCKCLTFVIVLVLLLVPA
jgi:hypothetical protein